MHKVPSSTIPKVIQAELDSEEVGPFPVFYLLPAASVFWPRVSKKTLLVHWAVPSDFDEPSLTSQSLRSWQLADNHALDSC
jgi:hypothetical protein